MQRRVLWIEKQLWLKQREMQMERPLFLQWTWICRLFPLEWDFQIIWFSDLVSR